MRRGEAFSLRWSDINFETETVIAQSKGGDTRTIPLAAPLLKKLLECKKDTGKVVEYKGEYKDASSSIIDTLRRDFKGSIAPECIGWNPFRHTFCTLLVQSGVSLDKVAMWAGHSAKICKRYYTRFIPKDQKDSDIDKM